MDQRTKQKLKFYLYLVGIVGLTIAVGIVFGYIAFLAWQIRMGWIQIKTELFTAMAAILLIMCISDIILFFHLVMRRKY